MIQYILNLCFVKYNTLRMSGHSKWANIKRKKQVNDQARGKQFSKLSRLISLAVVESGGITDETNNVRLRLAIEKARAFNMPKENIKRAIEHGAGAGKQSLREVVYEAFATGGVALVIESSTDNINRTLSEIRNVLEQNGGHLGTQGSVMYLFEKCGLVTAKKETVPENLVFEFADQIKAFDIDQDSEYYYIYIPFSALGHVKEFAKSLTVDGLEIDYKPKTTVPVDTPATAKRVLTLVDALESLDDVHKVFGNFDIPDSFLNQ